MKVDSDVLLLSYLDKICLTLIGEPRRALACLYSEARLYKGAREAPLSQSTTLHSTGNTLVWTKEVGHSNTRGTVRLCSFPLKFSAAHSLHFQHLMWTRGYNFKTSTVKRSLVSIVQYQFILTANEHTQTGSWLQIVEVTIHLEGMSVQLHTRWLVHYFTI